MSYSHLNIYRHRNGDTESKSHVLLGRSIVKVERCRKVKKAVARAEIAKLTPALVVQLVKLTLKRLSLMHSGINSNSPLSVKSNSSSRSAAESKLMANDEKLSKKCLPMDFIADVLPFEQIKEIASRRTSEVFQEQIERKRV